jgi:hypothetical protein
LINDRELQVRMGEAGHRRVASQFRMKDQINKFDDLYQSLAPIRTARQKPTAGGRR